MASVDRPIHRPEQSEEYKKTTEPRVLLIGENSQGFAHLLKHLEGRGCKCRFATSYQEAISLFGVQDFDLVLSPMRIRESSLFAFISLLERSRTTLFYFQAVEEGCWWLPALRFGQKCFGSNALRPSEFIASLELVVNEIQARALAAAKSLVSMPTTLAVARPWPGAKPATAKSAERPDRVKRRAGG